MTTRAPASSNEEVREGVTQLGLTGLLHKANLSKLEDITDLPNTQEQTPRVKHKKETEEYVPNTRTRQNLRKRNKDREAIYLIKVQINVHKMFTKLWRTNKHIENFNKDKQNIKESIRAQEKLT